MKLHQPPLSGSDHTSRGFLRICSLAALVLLAPTGSAQTDAEELARLRAENQALREQVAQLTEELDALRGRLAESQRDRRDLETQTDQLEAQAEQLREIAGVTTDGRLDAEQAQRIRQQTDPQTQRTRVSFGPEPLDVEGSPGEVFFSVVYSHHADVTPTSAVETVGFFIQTANAARIFGGPDPVHLLVDGESLSITPSDYEVQSRRTGLAGKSRSQRNHETVTLRLDRATLARLAAATSLSVRAGRATLTFDRDDLAALRAIHSRLVAEPTPDSP